MKATEVIELIKVGFEKPKLYKRSVWNKVVKVMEVLVNITNGEIVRTNLGSGLEKYKPTLAVTEEQLAMWALAYKRYLGFPLYLDDIAPELERISYELGVSVNNSVVLSEYFKRHPEDRK